MIVTILEIHVEFYLSDKLNFSSVFLLMKDKDKIIEIEPFEIGDNSKPKKLKILETSRKPQLWDIEFENNDILNFNLYVDYTKVIYFQEGKGNYNPVYHNGEITEFKKVEKNKGSYMTIEYNKKRFYLTLTADCPKCHHNELLVDSIDNIHTTLLDLEDDFGDRYQNKDEGSEIISSFNVKIKIEDEFDEIYDLDLKCLKCSRVFLVFLPEINENEVCEKMLEVFS